MGEEVAEADPEEAIVVGGRRLWVVEHLARAHRPLVRQVAPVARELDVVRTAQPQQPLPLQAAHAQHCVATPRHQPLRRQPVATVAVAGAVAIAAIAAAAAAAAAAALRHAPRADGAPLGEPRHQLLPEGDAPRLDLVGRARGRREVELLAHGAGEEAERLDDADGGQQVVAAQGLGHGLLEQRQPQVGRVAGSAEGEAGVAGGGVAPHGELVVEHVGAPRAVDVELHGADARLLQQARRLVLAQHEEARHELGVAGHDVGGAQQRRVRQRADLVAAQGPRVGPQRGGPAGAARLRQLGAPVPAVDRRRWSAARPPIAAIAAVA
eukprot:scaffold84899_cov63-Phaeocystis_antarctica.AAC.1